MLIQMDYQTDEAFIKLVFKIDSLQKKYSNIIKIDTDKFEKIKLTSIDMNVIYTNQAYPLIEPSFPILTDDHLLDYGKNIILISIFLFFLVQKKINLSALTDIFGCSDFISENYNSSATIDDGSCLYSGCTEISAINYDSTATVDDGNCLYRREYC